MEYSEQVVAVLSKCVVDVCRQMIAEYDIQVEKKLKNIVITGDNIKNLSIKGQNLGSGTIVGQNIAAGTITGNNIVTQSLSGDLIIDGSLSGVKIQNGTLSAAALITDEMTATIMSTVVANIAKADIDWAEIDLANINHANIVQAMVDLLKAGTVDADELKASLAQIQDAIIGMATIDLAQITTLNANDALMQRIVNDKAFIDNLKVGNANIVELLAEKVMVKGSDGEYYALVPNESNVLSEKVQIQGGALIDGSVSNTAMTANSITVNELNVSEISANEAFLLQLTAGIGRFGQLFANQAFLEQLKTHLIQSDYLTIKIRQDLQWSNGENILNNTSNQEQEITTSDFYSLGYLRFTNEIYEERKIACRAFLVPQEGNWRVSIRYQVVQSGQLVDGFFILDESPLNGAALSGDIEGTIISAGDSGWSELIMTLPVGTTDVEVFIENIERIEGGVCTYHSTKAELGQMFTPWTPSLDDLEINYQAKLTIRDKQIESTVSDLRGEISTARQEVGEFKTTIENDVDGRMSQVSQTLNGFTIGLQSTSQSVDQLAELLSQVENNLNIFFKFEADGLIITRGDSNRFSVRIDNEEMGFYEYGTKVAYINNNKMMVTNVQATNSFQLGNLVAQVQRDGVVNWGKL